METRKAGRTTEEIIRISPDRYFVNATLYNDSKVINPNQPFYIPAIIQQTRAGAFLTNPEEWNMSIIRLSVNSSAIPRISESTSSLVVGYNYNNVFYDVPVVIPFSPEPTRGLPTQSLYNIWSFVNLINAAFLTAQTAAAAGGAVFPYGMVFMTYNATTQLFSLYIPEYFGEGTYSTSPATIGVTMSFDLSQRLNSFPVLQNYPLQNNGHDIVFIKKFSGLNRIDGATNDFYLGPAPYPVMYPGKYMLLQQDCAWPSAIENVNRIAVTTGSLPAVTEYRSTSLYSQHGAGNNNQTVGILTDFFAGINAPISNSSEPFNYLPNVYRLTSLMGTQPLVTYDISISTVDREGTINQLFIPPDSLMDCKIIFLKKGLTN